MASALNTLSCIFLHEKYNHLFITFITQINLGVNDFQMVMTVLNDNLLEGQHGKYRLDATCSVMCKKYML